MTQIHPEQAGNNEAALNSLQHTLSDVMYDGEIHRNGTADLAVIGVGEGFPQTPAMQGDYRVATAEVEDAAGDSVIRVAVGRPVYSVDHPEVEVEPYQVGINVTQLGGSFVYTATIPSGDQVNEPARPRSNNELSPPKARLRVTRADNEVQGLLPGRIVNDVAANAPNLTDQERNGLRALARVVGQAGQNRQPDFMDETHQLTPDDLADLNTFLASAFDVQAPEVIAPDVVSPSLTAEQGGESRHNATPPAVGRVSMSDSSLAGPSSIRRWSEEVQAALDEHGYQPGPSPFADILNSPAPFRDIVNRPYGSPREARPTPRSVSPFAVVRGAIQRLRGMLRRRH